MVIRGLQNFQGNNSRTGILLAAAIAMLPMTYTHSLQAADSASQAAEARYDFNIPAQSLDSALAAFGEVSNLQILYDAALTKGVGSDGVSGSYNAQQALDMLLAGTGLGARVSSAGNVSLRRLKLGETNSQADMLDTIVTVGSRTPTRISEIPAAVWVVEKEELQELVSAGLDLKNALGRLIPGLDLAPQSRTNYGQNLRGRTAQVLIDGISMNSSRGLSRMFDSIDPFNVERVEVLSGASSLYGGSATGGIINIITRKGESGDRAFRTEAGITTGFNGSEDVELRLAQSVSGGDESMQSYLGVAIQSNGRQFDGNGKEIFTDITQTDLQDNQSIDLMGNLNIVLDEEQTLQFSAQLYKSGFNGDRGVYFPNLTAGTPDLAGAEIRDGYSSDRDPATDRSMLNLQYHHADLWGQDFYLQAFHRKEEASFQAFPYKVSGSYEFRASKQDTELSGIKALFDATLSEELGVSYGMDFDKDTFSADQMYFNTATSDASGGLVLQEAKIGPRYPGFEVTGMALFAQAEYQASEAIKLTGGMRHQKNDVKVEEYNSVAGGENDYSASLFNLGVIYDHDNGQQNWLRYSQGFELPNPAKYYGKAGYTVAENPLSAIETDQLELGWRFADGEWATQVALYYAWSDKSIYVNKTDLTIDVIDDKKRDFGLEGSVSRYFENGMDSGATLHLVRSEQEDSNGDWKKQDARYASLSSATAFVGWSDVDRSARLHANHAFDLEDDNNREIKGYTTFDLAISQEIEYGKLSLGVQNLLDKSYSTVWGQRAEMFYAPTYGPAYLYDFQGRGRTFSLTWSMDY